MRVNIVRTFPARSLQIMQCNHLYSYCPAHMFCTLTYSVAVVIRKNIVSWSKSSLANVDPVPGDGTK